jgi:hypothetical protein
MDPTLSREMPSCSAFDLAEIRRASKIPSYDIGKYFGLRTYQHPLVFGPSLLQTHREELYVLDNYKRQP